MILDPIQPIECDHCGNREELSMTPLARGSWDNRHIKGKLEDAGWITHGDRHYCCDDCELAAAVDATTENT